MLQCHTFLVGIRVYVVARDLGVTSRIVLLYLDSVGFSHRSAASALTEEAREALASARVVDIKREARARADHNRQQAPIGRQLW